MEKGLLCIHVHVHTCTCIRAECRGLEFHLRQLIFLWKKELSRVLLYCVALFVVSFDHVLTYASVSSQDMRAEIC